jgi:hypothetical protein
MSARPLTLQECRTQALLSALPAGQYDLEYHDATHLSADDWVRLAVVHVRATSVPNGEDLTERLDQFYTLRAALGDLPEKPAPGVVPKGKGENAQDPVADYERRVRTVLDAMSLALARLGLIAPEADETLLQDVAGLNEEDGVVLIPDTNALHNGAMHWLLKILRTPAVWVLPLVASITTVQTRDASLKGMLSKFRFANVKQALRSRGLVNGTLGLIERNRGRMQVVEIDPSLLRYQKMASGNGSDPDQSDVLEDRLIIEGIHGILRSMRSRTARRVVTSDVNIARVLAAEGVDTLFVPTIVLGTRTIDCLRYDPLMRGFAGAPIEALLWEFAHAFGAVRLARGGVPVARTDCYWPGKSPADWKAERLICDFSRPSPVGVPGNAPGPLAPAADSQSVPVGTAAAGPTLTNPLLDVPGEAPLAQPDPAPMIALEVEQGQGSPDSAGAAYSESAVISSLETAPTTVANQAQTGTGETARPPARHPRQSTRRNGGERKPSSITALPRASFPQALRLLGAVRRIGGGTVEDALRASGESITVDTARRGLEILRRTNLVALDGGSVRATPDAELVSSLLRQGDLDGMSAVFERFEPYRAFLDEMRENGGIGRGAVVEALQRRIGPVGTYEADRLPRFHILLGQVWTDGDNYVDGSRRPTDRDATDAFSTAFQQTSSVNLAQVLDLLPRFSALTRQSPWAAKRQIERLIAERLLPDYRFQPAAGGRPVARDEVLAGPLENPSTRPVVVDRLQLGERPVFTVGGPAR